MKILTLSKNRNIYLYIFIYAIFLLLKEKFFKLLLILLKYILISTIIIFIILSFLIYYIYINENEIIILEYIFNLPNNNQELLLYNNTEEEFKDLSFYLNSYIEKFFNKKHFPSYFQKDNTNFINMQLQYNKYPKINNDINIEGLMQDYIKYKYNCLLYDIILKDIRKIPILM